MSRYQPSEEYKDFLGAKRAQRKLDIAADCKAKGARMRVELAEKLERNQRLNGSHPIYKETK